MASDELLATCWTTAGNVRPGKTGLASPLAFEYRVHAALDTGYVGFGISHADIVTARDSIGYPRLRNILDRAGVKFLELEFLDYWWGAPGEFLSYSRMADDLLEAANEMGADHIKVGVGSGSYGLEFDEMVNSFGTLCERASEVGTRLALEPAAFSMMPTINPAVDLVAEVSHPSGGLLVDIWHIYRSGQDYNELLGLIPPEKLFAVELVDGFATPSGSLFDDCFDNRLPVGEGDFDVPKFVEVMREIGFSGPWGVEMMSRHHRSLPGASGAKRAADAAWSVL